MGSCRLSCHATSQMPRPQITKSGHTCIQKKPGDANLAQYALHEADRYQAALLQYRYTKAPELKSYLHKNAAGIAAWAAKEGEEKLLETIRAVPWDTAARAAFLDVSQAYQFVAASAAILELQRQAGQNQEERFQL